MKLRARVDGVSVEVEVDERRFRWLPGPSGGVLLSAYRARPVELQPHPGGWTVRIDEWTLEVQLEPAEAAPTVQEAKVRAPLPGRVARIWVAVGDEVSVGQPLITIEAMKMENIVTAPAGGRVRAVHVAVDERVRKATALVDIGPDARASSAS
jgi:biotin carboxyl carrier protein